MDEANIYKNRWPILIVTIAMTFMSCLDASIVNVALPDMTQKLHVDTSSISWVITIYLIVIVAFIIFFGKLSDLTGKSWVFRMGMLLFIFGSLGCGLANSLPLLLAARVVQAVGAAASMSTNQGIIAKVFPQGERGRALGISGASVALGNMAGPVVGGFIVSFLSWHYIFLINIPIGIVFVALGLKFLPRDSEKLHDKKALDIPGFISFAPAMILIFSSISYIGVAGDVNFWTLTALGLGLALFIGFIFWERIVEKPMLDLSIFKDRLFSLSILCAFLCFAGMLGTTFLLPFYIQNLLGLSPHVCGLILMASPLVLVVVAPLSGHTSDKIGSEMLTFIGLAIMGAGLAAMGIFYNKGTTVWLIVVIIGLTSLGNGMFQSPNTSLIMSHVGRDKLGVAGSVNGLVRNTGMAAGVTVAAILLYSMMSAKLGYRVLTYSSAQQDNAFVYAFHITMLVLAGITLLGAVLTGIRLLRRRRLGEE